MTNAEAVATALQEIGTAAGFVSRRTVPASALTLVVEGVGRIPLPISEATARRLCAVAQPAQHGYKEETRLDRRVRDSFEVDRRRISIDKDAWQATLQAQLEHIARDLGLPAGCGLHAELHNLLVYGPGQFFVGHQDSEKCDAMVATLVVGLPSSFRGGAMLIEHHGEKVQVRGSASRLTFTAFYADCRHEVRAVSHGYRAVLTFNLMIHGSARAQDTPVNTLALLTARLRQYFASTRPPRWPGEGNGDVPDRLIFLLDHQYTQRGLGWQRLKGADGPRVAALQAAAAELDCGICLALAEVHETWSCESDWDAGYRYEWDGDEDEDEGGVAASTGEHRLTELIDSEAQLRHFVGGEGKAVKMRNEIDSGELCYIRPSVEFDPFESEHEGYMGNYGNTLDRWYHRAAVVVWPRERGFVMRAKVEPGWALGEVIRTLRRQGASAASAQAASLLPFWAQAVRSDDDGRVLAQALNLAAGLDTPQLASGLLLPFALPQLKASMAGHWLRCLALYGLDWCKALLAQWLTACGALEASRLQWIADELPGLSQALHEAAGADARTLAASLLRQEWRWTVECWRTRMKLPSARARDDAVARLSQPLLGLIDAATRLGSEAVCDEILAALTASDDAIADVASLALDLLRAAQANPDSRLRSALAPLREHWCAQLAATLEQAPRRTDDWSMRLPLQCSCELCVELGGFLRDGQRVRREWPLAEARRRHLHHIIDNHELPLTHATRRSGRPYVLVLQKTADLFAREAAQRRAWQQDLDWLVGSGGNGG